jgi:anaphase-promoting complex subunit 10
VQVDKPVLGCATALFDHREPRNGIIATMPRPPRRAPQAREAAATPTRPTNAITGDIPPHMLQTPPHAPFLTSPLPPANNPGNSIIPNDQAQHNHNLRTHIQTPTANVNGNNNGAGHSQVSTNNLGSNMSDTEAADDESLLESAPHDPDDSRQLAGLRDISSLATWTLSSSKPGCALAQLRHPSPMHFWQSDGPQPHTLTLHFFKLVAIVKMRIYLDYELDESYTPTKIKFFGGMSEGGLVEFGSWEAPEIVDPETGEPTSSIDSVRGWIDVSLKGVGGRETRYHERHETPTGIIKSKKTRGSGTNLEGDETERDVGTSLEDDFDDCHEDDYTTNFIGGDVLKAMVVQVRICENYQNGKDTHVRGFQVFARDETGGKEGRRIVKRGKKGDKPLDDEPEAEVELVGIQEADWMGEPEIR